MPRILRILHFNHNDCQKQLQHFSRHYSITQLVAVKGAAAPLHIPP